MCNTNTHIHVHHVHRWVCTNNTRNSGIELFPHLSDTKRFCGCTFNVNTTRSQKLFDSIKERIRDINGTKSAIICTR